MRIYSSIVAGIGILALVGLATQRIRSRRDRADGADGVTSGADGATATDSRSTLEE